MGYDDNRATILQNKFGFGIATGEIVDDGGGRQVQLKWMGTPGHTYQVKFATNLEAPEWQDVTDGLVATPPGETVVPLSWSEDLPTPGAGLRYYRIFRTDQ